MSAHGLVATGTERIFTIGMWPCTCEQYYPNTGIFSGITKRIVHLKYRLRTKSISLFGSVFISNRGLVMPKPIAQGGLSVFLVALVIGVIASLVMRAYARHRLFKHGQKLTIWPFVVAMLIGLPLMVAELLGAPLTFEIPELKGFNFAGGSRIVPVFTGEAEVWADISKHAEDIEAQRYPYLAFENTLSALANCNSSSVIASLLYYEGIDISDYLGIA